MKHEQKQPADAVGSSEWLGASFEARRARMHCLKTWPEFFREVRAGNKTFEVRRDDRGFRVGDVLVLQEWDRHAQQYTGDMTARRVSYLLEGEPFGIVRGFVVMGLEACDVEAPNSQ